MPDPTLNPPPISEDPEIHAHYMKLWRLGQNSLEAMAQKLTYHRAELQLDQKRGSGIGALLQDNMKVNLSKMALEEMENNHDASAAAAVGTADNSTSDDTKGGGFEQRLRAAAHSTIKFVKETQL